MNPVAIEGVIAGGIGLVDDLIHAIGQAHAGQLDAQQADQQMQAAIQRYQTARANLQQGIAANDAAEDAEVAKLPHELPPNPTVVVVAPALTPMPSSPNVTSTGGSR